MTLKLFLLLLNMTLKLLHQVSPGFFMAYVKSSWLVCPFVILEKCKAIELDNFQGRDMGGEEEDQESPLLGIASQPDEPEEPLKRTGN